MAGARFETTAPPEKQRTVVFSLKRAFGCAKSQRFFLASLCANFWQEREESNPQPTVLETATLPVELRSYKQVFIS
jgi:hypothetical protein